uniref:Cyclin K n=1 Tax=Salmo trutta TaxID=8032 RepID=A0A674B768_SALTR
FQEILVGIFLDGNTEEIRDKNKVQKLVQMAWTFWEPEIIAVAVMYLGWTSKQFSRRWLEQFVQDVPVELLEDICHQILDLYSQGKQQMPQTSSEKTPPPPTPVPTPQQLQTFTQLPLPNPPVLPPLSKKVSPQTSPTLQLKQAHVSLTLELKGSCEGRHHALFMIKLTQLSCFDTHFPCCGLDMCDILFSLFLSVSLPEPVDSKIPRLEPPMPPLPTDLHQPPPLHHRPAPPPTSSYIMGIPTSSSYMSGKGSQSLQSMMKTEGPSYSTIPSLYGPPLAYHSHVYPPNTPPSGPPPLILHPRPPTPAGVQPQLPSPPRMPPAHGDYLPAMGIPPSSYPPHPGGQSQVPPPLPPGKPLQPYISLAKLSTAMPHEEPTC